MPFRRHRVWVDFRGDLAGLSEAILCNSLRTFFSVYRKTIFIPHVTKVLNYSSRNVPVTDDAYGAVQLAQTLML